MIIPMGIQQFPVPTVFDTRDQHLGDPMIPLNSKQRAANLFGEIETAMPVIDESMYFGKFVKNVSRYGV